MRQEDVGKEVGLKFSWATFRPFYASQGDSNGDILKKKRKKGSYNWLRGKKTLREHKKEEVEPLGGKGCAADGGVEIRPISRPFRAESQSLSPRCMQVVGVDTVHTLYKATDMLFLLL
jgi:hypothetical protein